MCRNRISLVERDIVYIVEFKSGLVMMCIEVCYTLIIVFNI